MARGPTPSPPLRPVPSETHITLHASCVALDGRAALILGASGSGKSGLALQLIALGAGLVADDRTQVTRKADTLIAAAPTPLKGLIEARQVGILRTPLTGPAQVTLIVDMDVAETDRLPPERTYTLLGLHLPLIRKSTLTHFPAAITTYLKGGRAA